MDDTHLIWLSHTVGADKRCREFLHRIKNCGSEGKSRLKKLFGGFQFCWGFSNSCITFPQSIYSHKIVIVCTIKQESFPLYYLLEFIVAVKLLAQQCWLPSEAGLSVKPSGIYFKCSKSHQYMIHTI